MKKNISHVLIQWKLLHLIIFSEQRRSHLSFKSHRSRTHLRIKTFMHFFQHDLEYSEISSFQLSSFWTRQMFRNYILILIHSQFFQASKTISSTLFTMLSFSDTSLSIVRLFTVYSNFRRFVSYDNHRFHFSTARVHIRKLEHNHVRDMQIFKKNNTDSRKIQLKIKRLSISTTNSSRINELRTL